MKITKYLSVVVSVAMLALSSCKKDKNDNNDGSDKGTMKVKMTDAPGDYSTLNVEITKVEAYNSDNSAWVTLNSETQRIDVMSLTNGNETTIASTSSIESGLYTKLRLTFGNNNSLTLHSSGSGSSFSLNFASETHKQVEIEINEQFSTSSSSEILIDFNVARSITFLADNYYLNAFITEIKELKNGIKGKLVTAPFACVHVREDGSLVDFQSTYADANGRFIVKGMPAGTYDLVIEARQADVDNGNADAETVVQNVEVTQGQVKDLGNIDVKED